MGRAWDSSAGHRSSVDDVASAGVQLPENAAVWSKLAAVPAPSTRSRCDGPSSARRAIDSGWDLCARLTWLARQLSSDVQIPSPMQSMTDWMSPCSQQHGPSATRGPSGKQPTRTMQRLRIPMIATALVRLVPILRSL